MVGYLEIRKGEVELKQGTSNLVNAMVEMMTSKGVSNVTDEKATALAYLINLYNNLKSKKITPRNHNKLDQIMLSIDKIFTVLFNENKRNLTNNKEILDILESESSISETLALNWWSNINSWFSKKEKNAL